MNEAKQLGYSAAQTAADAADRRSSDWSNLAYNALLIHAKSHEFFTIEQVRIAAVNVPKIDNDRAWGAIATRAHKDGLIVKSAIVSTTSKTAHGANANMWRSLIVDVEVKCRNQFKEKYG